MDENNFNATISLDMKKFRIRIYKATLNLLGPPKYIQLLVNPTECVVAIRGLEERCKESHAVSFTRLRPDNSYELYSKQLILTLMSLLPALEKDCTYRLSGEAHIDEKIAFFPLHPKHNLQIVLDTVQRVEGGN